MLHFSFLLVITAASLSAEYLIVVSFQPLEYSCHAEVGIPTCVSKHMVSSAQRQWCLVLGLCSCPAETILHPRDLVLDCLLIPVEHLYSLYVNIKEKRLMFSLFLSFRSRY